MSHKRCIVSLQVWSLAQSKCIASLDAHRAPIRKLEIVGQRLFSGVVQCPVNSPVQQPQYPAAP
jgi:hypothetical protein